MAIGKLIKVIHNTDMNVWLLVQPIYFLKPRPAVLHTLPTKVSPDNGGLGRLWFTL